jgi:23S rRNA (adenine2503-C2)-methyltransferase
MPNIHDASSVEELCRRERLDPDILRRFRTAFLKHRRSFLDALDVLPIETRDRFMAEVDAHALELVERHDSAIDGATKLLFRTVRGDVLETVVLRISSGRTALCVSSQVGCAAACVFCATGRMGSVRDLSAPEILDQVVQANLLLASEGRSVRNIVFMGMGEPFHNEVAVHESVRALIDPRLFAHSPGRILVSTVGIPEAMLRFARDFPRVHLALSLHSAIDDVRRRIVPLARRHGVAELFDAVRDVSLIQGQTVMLEYLLLDGINDRDEDLEALATQAADLDVHVNLIPYNPIEDAAPLSATPAERIARFSAALKSRGFRVTTRYSLGGDIRAACGQLVRRRAARRTAAERIDGE